MAQRLAPRLRDKVLKDWGPARAARADDGGRAAAPFIVVPVAQYGNVALVPQPARGWGEDGEKMFHAKDLAPPHQYVAAYAWLRNGFKARRGRARRHPRHAGVAGRQGHRPLERRRLRCADGRHPRHLHLQRRRRRRRARRAAARHGDARRSHGAAFKKGGLLPPSWRSSSELITDYVEAAGRQPGAGSAPTRSACAQQLIALGIAKDLGLKIDKPGTLTEEVLHEIEEHLLALKGQNIPYGLHTFGRAPAKAERDSTVDAIVSVDRSLLPNKAKVLRRRHGRSASSRRRRASWIAWSARCAAAMS